MGQELNDNLGSLRAMAPQLNAATAEASSVVQAVEQFLGDELAIGVAGASRPFDSQRAIGEGDRELLVTSHLAFGRFNGRDRIYVLKATLEKAEWKEHFTKVVAEDRVPWTACSREIKLQSFAMLPELIGNLASRVEEVALQTTKTVQTVRELLDAMRHSTQAPPPPPAPSHSRAPDPAPAHEPDPEPASDGLSLHDLTANATPGLFKRSRARSMSATSAAGSDRS